MLIPIPFLVIVIIIAFAGGAACGIGLYIYRSGKGTKEDKPVKSTKNPITNGVMENADAFAGLYEPMYCCSKNGKYAKRKAVFETWGAAVNELGVENADFISAYNKKFGKADTWKGGKKFKKNAKLLLKSIKRAGVTRDRADTVVFDSTTLEKYDFSGSAELSEGEILEVLSPYWRKGEVILQKGIIR